MILRAVAKMRSAARGKYWRIISLILKVLLVGKITPAIVFQKLNFTKMHKIITNEYYERSNSCSCELLCGARNRLFFDYDYDYE